MQELPDLLGVFRRFTLAWEGYVRELAGLLGVSLNEGMALSYLTTHGTASAKELGTALHFTSGATTTLVDRLVHRDLVERRAHPTDRRVSLVALTAGAEHQLADGRSWLAAAVLEVPDERKAQTVLVLTELTAILTGLSERLSSTSRTEVQT
ncbi:MAG: MarR family transcriptional regulator [Actinomycetota bacterium]|nr:MarR family transcriptional regulator [Actinomycetota bacterium]